MRYLALSLIVACGIAHAADLPGIDTNGLSDEAKKGLDSLLTMVPCPCDDSARTSMQQCIADKTCPVAIELGAYAAGQFKQGLGLEEVREAVINKYMDDHVVFRFDLNHTPRKGSKKAKVVIVEFADFECPHCAAMRTTLSDLVKAFPKRVAVYFKQFPLGHHEYSTSASQAALAAHKQGRFWPMHDLIFSNQGSLEEGSFKAFAGELGLNLKRFEADMQSPEVMAQIQNDRKEGEGGVRSTPTLFINGKLYHGEHTVDGLKQHVSKLLKIKTK